MGNNCCGTENREYIRNTSTEWLTKASAYTSEKYNATKDYLGPQIMKA